MESKKEQVEIIEEIKEEDLLNANYEDSQIKDPVKKENHLGFIDLCSGTGGFHTALDNIEEIQTQCIISSDIDKNCRKVYYLNHGLPVYNDLSKIDYSQKDFDIICAGFPCQSFSVAGKRLGLDDARGTVIYDILNIVRLKKPMMIVLENVKGLKSMKNQDQNNEEVMAYKLIQTSLDELGYYYYDRIISPHEINIPQKRERVVIIAIRKDLLEEKYKTNKEYQEDRLKYVEELIKERKEKNKNKEIFQKDEEVNKDYLLNDEQNNALKLWKNFTSMKEWDELDNKELSEVYLSKVLCKTPEQIKKVKKHRNFKQIHFFTDFLYFKESMEIPKELEYNKRKTGKISNQFKKQCDLLNILYENSQNFKKLVDKFLTDNKELIKSIRYQYKYLEYSGGEDFGKNNSFDNMYCQFRMSGVRIRKSNYFPTLVKSGPLPVIIKKNRFITDIECGRLQSFKKDFKFLSKSSAIKQTGNAVNTEVIELMIRSGFDSIDLSKYEKNKKEKVEKVEKLCDYEFKRGKNKGKKCNKKNCKQHKKEEIIEEI